MKSVIVNLELWYLYEEEQHYEDIIQKTYQLAVADIDNNTSADAVIGLLLCDGFLYKNNEIFYSMLSRLQQYCENAGIKDFIIITGIVDEYQDQLVNRNLKWKIYKWDFSVNGVYQSYKNKIDLLPEWNPLSNKFLFLGGQPARKNRITLLSKFYNKQMLNNAVWSFFPPISDKDKQWCRLELKYYSDIEYENFLKNCERKVDDLYVTSKNYAVLTGKEWIDSNMLNSEFLNDPNFINPQIFHDTSISVLSEGHVHPPGNDYRFLTEKTWRAVINRHPFILACVPQRFEFMKSKGLSTFENYLEVKDYIYIENEEQRLDAVVYNISKFNQSIHQHKEQIYKDIYNNYKRFFEIVKENYMLTNMLIEKYNVTEEQINYWFEQKSFVHLFRVPK